MQVVSVINYKGGVGKTTLTANLGAYAAMKGLRVLLIDLDPQTQLTFNFITPEDWTKIYMNDRTLRNFFVPIIRGENAPTQLSKLIIPARAGSKRIDIISSHLDLIDTETELAAMIPAPTIPMLAANSLKIYSYLRIAMQELRDKYDLVLMDCPPSFYVIVKNALLASDYYLIPSRLDYLSTLGVNNLQRSVKKILELYNDYMQILKDSRYKPMFLSILGVVPMMVNYLKGDELIAANKKYLEYLKSNGHYLFRSVRNNSSVFAPKPTCGEPIVMTKPNFFKGMQQKIVNELKELGEEFLTRLKVKGA